MSNTKGQSTELPTYTLRYTTIPKDGKSPAIGGKTDAHKLELPRQLDLLEAAYWASVILTEMSNNSDEHILFGASYLPTLEIKKADSRTEQTSFCLYGDPLRPNHFYVRPPSEDFFDKDERFRWYGYARSLFISGEYPAKKSFIRPVSEKFALAAELNRHRMNAYEIWGDDTSAITWGVRDLEINAQYPGLNRKLPEKSQAFLDRHNGDLAAAIKTSRLIDQSNALTWFRSMQKTKG